MSLHETAQASPPSNDPVSPADSVGKLRQALRFLRLALRKAEQDNLLQQSAALAFTTIVSLVPLLAAFSVFGARWFDQERERTIQLLAELLPYSADNLMLQLDTFIGQAQAVRGVGFAIFLMSSLAVFTVIEQTINRIWNVPQARPFRSRFLSFTLLLFWGPVVIGATYTLLFYLRQQDTLQGFSASIPAELLPVLVTALGLTMLYWQVPYTAVRFRSAVVGGITAALLLEGLRQGFGLYVAHARNVSVVYGSFGFAFFFMLSIQLTWWIVLLGTEVSYCVQNYQFMFQTRRRASATEGSWIALATLALLTHRFRQGEPLTPHEMLAEQLQLATDDLRQALSPLLDEGVLQETVGDTEGYLLSRDPYDFPLARLYEIYEGRHWRLLRPLPAAVARHLEDLRTQLDKSRTRTLGKRTLARLAEPLSKPAAPRPAADASTPKPRAVANS